MAYRYVPRFEWVAWEMPSEEQLEEATYESEFHEGFRAKILMNPTNGEVRAESKAYDALSAGTIEIEDYYQLIAPRIVDWELEAELEDGTWEKVPAPGINPETNWQSMLLLPYSLVGWLIARVRYSYVPKAKTQPSKHVGTTDSEAPTEPIQLVPKE